MIATYVHRGEIIDYTPEADVAAGDVVVINNIVGIAKLDIKAGEHGALAIIGVYDIAKASGENTAIGKGVRVFWNATNKQITTDPTDVYIGKTLIAATDDDTTARVLLGEPYLPVAGSAIADITDNSGGTAADSIAEITDVAGAASGVASNSAKINSILAIMRSFGFITAS